MQSPRQWREVEVCFDFRAWYFTSNGLSRRPASKKHVQALESQIETLKAFIKELGDADDSTRNILLGTTARSVTSPTLTSPHHHPSQSHLATSQSHTSPTARVDSEKFVLARTRGGRLRKLTTRAATQFYGGTSPFQMSMSESRPLDAPVNSRSGSASQELDQTQLQRPTGAVHPSYFPFQPKDQTCRRLMAIFFKDVYQYNFCVYREWFLRDYDAGDGPYYSVALLYSICAYGALVSEDPSHRPLSAVFASYAEKMVLESLELPDLTTLQSLALLGHLAVGQGKSSKGWLYCGMAFRLTHEMGLHLDPNNWTTSKSKSEFSVEREILRRVYWAVFVADKQLSLYFGRPPALYPHEADVQNTIRIPYPPEWESLLDTYISKGTSSTAFEDGISFSGSFIQQIELAKIFHTMIVDVFENRRRQPGHATAAAATVQQVHTALVQWLTQLPQKLHWNQWTVGQVPPYVLHLHMLFHTAMIILNRPPKEHLDDENVATDEGVEVCYESLSAILRLIRSYGRYYRFELLPLDFVQTLSAAADVVMMKRYMDQSSWDDRDISQPLTKILQTMRIVQEIFPCMREIRSSILRIMESPGSESEQIANGPETSELDLMDLLQVGAVPFPGALDLHDEAGMNSADLGIFVTEDFLDPDPPWNDNSMQVG